jgi:hypothetical protein
MGFYLFDLKTDLFFCLSLCVTSASFREKEVHQGLILCPSCVPEKVGLNKKLYSHHK